MKDYNIYIHTEIKGPIKKTAKYGYVIELMENENVIDTLVEMGCLNDATANRLEVAAVCMALKRIKKRSRVTFYTSSIYLQNAFEKDWLGQWQQSGWENKKQQAVKNEDIWKMVAELSKKHDMSIIRQQQHQYTHWLTGQMQKEEIPPGMSRIIPPT